MEIKITLEQLKSLLDGQKKITAERLVNNSGFYNKESNDSNYVPMKIDETKFYQLASKSEYPSDLKVLEKYIKN